MAITSIGGFASAADTTWTGAAAGTWNVAGNWNNGAPTAGSVTNVDNGAGGNVTVNVTASATTGTLNISIGDMVAVNNAASLSLSGNGTTSLLNNAGDLAINAAATSTRLRFTNAATGVDAQITGGGTISLNGVNAVIDGTAAVRVVNTNNYIHGQGNIGLELITFDNNATIAADVNGGTLTLDPDGGSGTLSFMRNKGTMRATNGGILLLTGNAGGTFNNANGTIEAQNDSAVRYTAGAFVSGGTFTISGNGSHRITSGQSATFNGVTNTGLMVGENNSAFIISTSFTNNGTISLEPTTNATNCQIANDAALSGSGQLIMNGALANITGPDNARLTNGVGHTIRGQGAIGLNTIWVTNNGLIAADVPGGTLDLTADATAGNTAFINSGTLRATNGATLVINGAEGNFTNTGGLIEARNGSQVRFINTVDTFGGTLNSIGTGSLRLTAGHSAGFTDVTNNGSLVGENGSNLSVAGTISNNGTISIDSGANQTLFSVPADTTLAGAGTIFLNGALAGISGSDDRRLTNGPNHTIRGQGQIGFVTIWVTNQGTIASDVNGATLTLAADATAGQNAFINTGRLIATNGGILALSGAEGEYTSTGGTIEAQDGSTVQFVSSANILGGTFVSTGTGVFRVPAGNQVLLNNITVNGMLIAENNSNIQTFGPILNNGTILIDSGTLSTFLNVRAPTLLDGTGQLILSGTLASAGGLNDQRLTNGPDHTIRGQGLVGGTEIWVTNNGTILSDVSGGSITLAADGTAGASAFINDGTLRATNGASMVFGPSEGGFSGLGSVVADANSNVQSVSSVVVNQGPVSGAGTFSALGGSNFTATSFRVLNLVVNASTARVRSGAGTIGTSKVETLTLAGTGRLDLTDHDLALDYSGSSPVASIRPLIASAFGTGNWAGVGITSSSAAAAAPTANKTGLGYADAADVPGGIPTGFAGVSTDATTVFVRYTLLGDVNLDRSVNISDFSLLASNFNTAGLWSRGDTNYDGTVNIGDFSLLASNFNKTLAIDIPRGAAVPEPATMTALLLCSGCVFRRRRH